MSRNAEIIFLDTNYKYGFHSKKYPTFVKTIQNLESGVYPCTAAQIYIANSRSKAPPHVDVDDIFSAREILNNNDSFKGLYLCIHGSLLYNLAGSTKLRKDPNFTNALNVTCTNLIVELDIGAGLGAGIVVHIGSAVDKEKGIKIIAKTINYVLTKVTAQTKELAKKFGINVNKFILKRKIILENCAGEGNKIGTSLEEIHKIISKVSSYLRPQVKVCIDTAHAFGAGLYDWGKPSEVKRFYKEFDKIIGLDHLEVFHLNDSRSSSKKANNGYFGSKKDRHENLGLGYTFGNLSEEQTNLPKNFKYKSKDRLDGLKEIFKQSYKRGIPMIGEPPAKTEDGRDGLGGTRDWGFVCELLKNEKFCLEDVYEI